MGRLVLLLGLGLVAAQLVWGGQGRELLAGLGLAPAPGKGPEGPLAQSLAPLSQVPARAAEVAPGSFGGASGAFQP